MTFDELVRDLLLAMVSSQNEANKNFIAGIDDLAATNITLNYKKNLDKGKTEDRQISGNALAFGITPALLQIQSGIIEIKTALTVTKNTTSTTSASSKNVRAKAGYLFKPTSVDAKYQNTYSYKAESASIIRITVVPTPPPQPLMDAIKALTEAAPAVDKAQP
jgi:hypothetical protein